MPYTELNEGCFPETDKALSCYLYMFILLTYVFPKLENTGNYNQKDVLEIKCIRIKLLTKAFY